MAKSKAKKLREKWTREGKRNPELSRSPFTFTDLRTRTTKTKSEILNTVKHKKNHPSSGHEDNGSLF